MEGIFLLRYTGGPFILTRAGSSLRPVHDRGTAVCVSNSPPEPMDVVTNAVRPAETTAVPPQDGVSDGGPAAEDDEPAARDSRAGRGQSRPLPCWSLEAFDSEHEQNDGERRSGADTRLVVSTDGRAS
jgi:hypothetical protein